MQYFAACLPKLHPQAWHSFYSVVTRISFVGETGVILGTAEKIWPKVCRKGREGRRSVHGAIYLSPFGQSKIRLDLRVPQLP